MSTFFARAELGLHATSAGKAELGDDDRLTLGVVDGVLEEPATDVVDEHPVLEWVDPTRRDLGDRGRPFGSERGDGDDRGDDDVDRDHVDGALGDARELVEQATGVGDQDRLGHPEPADPARLGFGERGLDDRRSHDRHRDRPLDVGQRLLAERLRERIGIGPADARRPGSPGFDELVLHPSVAQGLRLRGQRRCAGCAEFGPGLRTESLEVLPAPAGGVRVRAEASARRHFAAPVDADVERAVAHELLGGVAAPVAGDVTGRHGHQVRGDADLVAEIGDA